MVESRSSSEIDEIDETSGWDDPPADGMPSRVGDEGDEGAEAVREVGLLSPSCGLRTVQQLLAHDSSVWRPGGLVRRQGGEAPTYPHGPPAT